jgi:hypothetical protein
MYAIFGGNVKDLHCFLAEERLPDRWEPKNREAYGHTIVVRSLIVLTYLSRPQALCFCRC